VFCSLANQPMEQMIEWPMEDSPLGTSLVVPTMQMADGYVDVPPGPGLGVELDWTVIERFRVG
jgi:L-alanine-DL-glutamate epimerase-like enolase superfamily enzyme